MAGWIKNDGNAPKCSWVEVQFFDGAFGVISSIKRPQDLEWGLKHFAPIICWREVEEPLKEQVARLEAIIKNLPK